MLFVHPEIRIPLKSSISIINQVVTFIIEIMMLVAYGRYPFTNDWSLTIRILAAIFILMIIGWLWSQFLAPKAKHRIDMPYLALVRAVLFLGASYCLFLSGFVIPAVIMAVLTIITQVISTYTEKTS